MVENARALNLPEKFVVLSHEHALGVVNSLNYPHIQLQTVFAGLTELLLLDKVELDAEDRLILLDPSSTQHPALDDIVRSLDADRAMKLKKWVSYFNNHWGKRKEIYQEVVNSLVAKGILREEKDQVFVVFPKKSYEETDEASKVILDDMRNELLGNEPIQTSTAALFLLLDSSRLIKVHFTKQEAGQMKDRLSRSASESSLETVRRVDRIVKQVDQAFAVIYGGSGG